MEKGRREILIGTAGLAVGAAIALGGVAIASKDDQTPTTSALFPPEQEQQDTQSLSTGLDYNLPAPPTPPPYRLPNVFKNAQDGSTWRIIDTGSYDLTRPKIAYDQDDGYIVNDECTLSFGARLTLEDQALVVTTNPPSWPRDCVLGDTIKAPKFEFLNEQDRRFSTHVNLKRKTSQFRQKINSLSGAGVEVREPRGNIGFRHILNDQVKIINKRYERKPRNFGQQCKAAGPFELLDTVDTIGELAVFPKQHPGTKYGFEVDGDPPYAILRVNRPFDSRLLCPTGTIIAYPLNRITR